LRSSLRRRRAQACTAAAAKGTRKSPCHTGAGRQPGAADGRDGSLDRRHGHSRAPCPRSGIRYPGVAMIFPDLQKGDSVFVNANTLIYHFTNHPKYGAACTALIERIELKELQGFPSSHSLADVAHRIMTIEAMGRFSWPATSLAARLKKHHADIPKLGLYQQ